MTLSRTNPRAKPRWLLLAGLVTVLTMAIGGLVLASHGGASAIPAEYAPFTVTDQQGANDVPGQVDLTQMGRDDLDATTYKLFWSWDSISAWTGQGQTGDACALFDNNNNTFIDFVVCVRVENFEADPTNVVIRLNGEQPAFAFFCSDKKNDRCTNPTPAPYSDSQLQAGALDTSPLAETGNLITHTDPFFPGNPVGESHPDDSTVEVHILKSFVPGNEVLVNVCSYPSAGNGGNNNPFDCIVSPGGGFLRVVKSAGTVAPNFTFSAARGQTTLGTFTALGSTTATVNPQPSSQTLLPVLVDPNSGPNVVVTETSIPSPWDLTAVSCKVPPGGASTGTADLTNDRITAVSIQSGAITECTFTNNLLTGTLVVIKTVVNDNGGTAVASDFTYTLGDGSSATQEPGAESPGTSYTRDALTTYNVEENAGGPSGYSVTYSADCTGTIAAGVTKTCTITNDDNEPSLTLVKTVTNDNGGTALATAWTLTADGALASPTDLSGTTPVASGTGFKADTYTLGESGPSNYTAGAWDCVFTGTTDEATMPTADSVTVGLGQDITCTIDNDDNEPSLTLVKTVTNDNGGTALATAWTLTADGALASPTDLSGTTPVASGTGFKADTYTLGESGPANYTDGTYTAGDWDCVFTGTTDEATMPTDSSVTVGLGEDITCTINNDDDKASPTGTTVQSWILHDTLTIPDLRIGAPDAAAATVTFSVYSDENCSVQVGTDEEVSIVAGVAETEDGVAVALPGYYYWIASYSGDQYNNAFDTECGDEITRIQALDEENDDPIGPVEP